MSACGPRAAAWATLGETDHPTIVLDEVMGMLVALAGLPPGWQWVLLGFVLFRTFDVLKPFPLKYLESLPGGLGVVMDDVAAGVMAWVVLRVVIMKRQEADEYIKMGALNGLFVLARTIGLIGHYLDQKALKQGLYPPPCDDIAYMLPEIK